MKRLLVVPVLAALALAGCGSSGSSPSAQPTSPAASSSAPSNQPADPAAAKAEITANWEAFFNVSTPRSKAVSLLEDGTTMGGAIAMAARQQQAMHLQEKAKVTSIEFQAADDAIVHYELLNGKTVLLPDAAGHALLKNGKWVVAKATFCALVQQGAGGSPVPGCS